MITIKKKSDPNFSENIIDAQYQPINFNGNYPYRVIVNKNGVNYYVYDHTIKLIVEGYDNQTDADTYVPYEIDIYDNTNTLLKTLKAYPASESIFETHHLTTDSLRIVVRSKNWIGDTQYSRLIVTNQNDDSVYYDKWGLSTQHSFTLNTLHL